MARFPISLIFYVIHSCLHCFVSLYFLPARSLIRTFARSFSLSRVSLAFQIDAEGTAEALKNAEKICIVPGYGMAVAQAAGVVADIALKLRADGKDVKFAVYVRSCVRVCFCFGLNVSMDGCAKKISDFGRDV